MTALVGREVERTFSVVGRYLAGLPGTQSNEAGGQDVGDLIELLGDGHVPGVERIHRNRSLRFLRAINLARNHAPGAFQARRSGLCGVVRGYAGMHTASAAAAYRLVGGLAAALAPLRAPVRINPRGHGSRIGLCFVGDDDAFPLCNLLGVQ